jgi:hypothetical protein
MLNRIGGTAFFVFAGIITVAPVMAQDPGLHIDQEHSTARLFLASSKSPEARVNVGVARISGVANGIGDDPSEPVFDFTIDPADEPTPSSGKWGYQNHAVAAAHTVVRFRSKRVVPMGGGTYRVTGELMLTYVERSTTYDPSEAYAGPVYGPPVMHSEKQAAVFEFERVDASNMRERKNDTAEFSGSSVVSGEDFPGLLTAVSAMDWPVFVSQEHCTMPFAVGEDFSGPACTGNRVEVMARTDVHCEMPSTVGEDFAGEVCTGTPLEMATYGGTQNGTETRRHKGAAKEQLIANEVEFQLVVRLMNTDSPHGGTSGQ